MKRFLKRYFNVEQILVLALLLAGIGAVVFAGNGTLRACLGNPGCTLNRLTGLLCPACGGTRAVSSLLGGNVGLAWRYNPLVPLLAPPAVVAWFYLFYFFIRGLPLPRINIPPALIWTLFALVMLFGVIRNIPHPLFEPLRQAPLL